MCRVDEDKYKEGHIHGFKQAVILVEQMNPKKTAGEVAKILREALPRGK